MRPRLLQRNATLDKLAWSNAIKQEVLQLYGKLPDMKQYMEDEEAFKEMLTIVEGTIPRGISKVKHYMIWLVGQYVKEHMWDLEDADDIRGIMHDYYEFSEGGKISKDLGKPGAGVENLEQVKNAVIAVREATPKAKGDEKSDEEEMAIPPTGKRNRITDKEWESIHNNIPKVYDDGTWRVFKIPQNPNPEQIHGMQLLTNNDIWDSHWCTGRSDMGPSRYWKEGPFWAFQKDEHSTYAISTGRSSNGMTIWNRANTDVWNAEMGTDAGNRDFVTLKATAQEKNIDLGLEQISSLPPAIIHVLEALVKKDKDIQKYIPKEQFVKPDFTGLRKVISAAPLAGLISDLRGACTKTSTKGIASVIFNQIVDMRMDLSEEYSEFDSDSLVEYIEALARNNQKLPQSLEDAILEALANAG